MSTDKEYVAKELEKASKRLANLLEYRHIELMRPSDIIVSVANVLFDAAQGLRQKQNPESLDE